MSTRGLHSPYRPARDEEVKTTGGEVKTTGGEIEIHEEESFSDFSSNDISDDEEELL